MRLAPSPNLDLKLDSVLKAASLWMDLFMWWSFHRNVFVLGENLGKKLEIETQKPPKNPVVQLSLILLNFFLLNLCFYFPYRQRNQLAQALVCGVSGIPTELGQPVRGFPHYLSIRVPRQGLEAAFPIGRFICLHRSCSGLVKTICRKIQGQPSALTFL